MEKFIIVKNVAYFVGTFIAVSVMIALTVAVLGAIGGYEFRSTLAAAQVNPFTIVVSFFASLVQVIWVNEKDSQ